MRDIPISIILILTIYCCSNSNNDDWEKAQLPTMEDKLFRQVGNITYFFNSDISIDDRNAMIKKCKQNIKDNLKMINESELSDSAYIIFVRDRDEMYKLANIRASGTVFTADFAGTNMVFCIYNEDCPIKHELMHLVTLCKWNTKKTDISLAWLSEGLATYADPETECDGYSFEEKYAAFLQNKMLVSMDSLAENFHRNLYTEKPDMKDIKIRYNQSAYIVQYLIENYGMNKIKELWQSGMDNFQKIYGKKIEDILLDIEDKLNTKYPNPIDFDWDKFGKRWIK
ncbi:MAG: peptidase MA family metallohydrolase [Dysgonomonas sp.]